MKNWKLAFFICLIVLVVTNTSWYYYLSNTDEEITYSDDMVEKNDIIITILNELFVNKTVKYSKSDIRYLLEQKYPKAPLVEEDNRISFRGIEFKFENDSLVSIVENWW